MTSTTPKTQRAVPRWLEPLVLLGPAGIWLLLLFVLPMGLIGLFSLVADLKPGALVNITGLQNYTQLFDPVNLRVMGQSLFLATCTTVICLITGYPVAYWLTQKVPARWQKVLLLAFVLPLWTSSLLRTYAWITILRPTGVLNTFLNALRLPSLDLLYQLPAVLIGLVSSWLPFMVLILYASLSKLDRRLLEAAADLGATPRQAFMQVTIPQTRAGIIAGALLVFVNAIADFVVPEVLGGASSMTVPRLIFSRFLSSASNWGVGSAWSFLLILVVSLMIVLLLKYGDRNASKAL
ncbi:ABC transporter permease [filamentous cyanobacterium LEGE 11480]|uniref:ABC transporter permease n=1 Tax=Romeriopsis navalis LEGE 11480 TaxID=2777977 RepID=A0A928VKT6_9CYAN|nr:ABC transporter permease [Romeriopsis navalis]MBE9030165.1 ABC transporter permease [Romeriopsis navalis LEGE 11480]